MKVLHLLRSNRFSGAENVVCQIMGMFENESDVEMIYCSPEGPIREALSERGIQFVPLEKFTVDEIRRIVKEQKPDIIHAHDMRAGFYAARACGNVSLVSHIHNNAFDSRGISAKSIAYMYAAVKAKHIFWVSNSSYEGYAFHRLFKKKSTILYNIINVKALYDKMQLDTNKYNYDVVYVGRLSYPKNPQRLMNVFRLIKEKSPSVRMAIVGTGELEEEIKTLAKEYELLENIDFLGFQSNPLKILHDSKVMVMTSRWEGTPMCALEAMALGVPIVSTPTDGLKDLVKKGQNGYLTDNDQMMAQQIINIIEDRELHRRYSSNTKNQAEQINNINSYKKELIRVYKRG